MRNDFVSLIQSRRSNYELGKALPIPQIDLYEWIADTLFHAPSPYNAQTIELYIFWNEEHDALWDFVIEEKARKNNKPKESFEKLHKMKNAAATIVFLEDAAYVQMLVEQYPKSATITPQWFLEGQGVLQGTLWNLLTASGLGANLQHYNEEIKAYLTNHHQLDQKYEVNAQLVFGSIIGAPPHKDKKLIATRIHQVG